MAPPGAKNPGLPVPLMLVTGGGTVLLVLLAFAKEHLPALVQQYGYMVLRTNTIAKVAAAVLMAAHVVEVRTAWKMCQKKRYSASTSMYYCALTLVFGFPILQTLKKMEGGA